MSQNLINHPSKYARARHNFVSTAQEQATLLRSWQHPLRGLAGEKLYLDLAWFGSLEATKVLVLISGTHGVEGYCGSGIQVGSIKTKWHLQAGADVAIAMIHGVNPHGMSYWRRVNEDGVDLNRNFVDFHQSLPENSLYDTLAEVIVPQQWSEETQSQTLEQLTDYFFQHPDAAPLLAQGQYTHWYAPFYGGTVPVWSNRVMRQIVEQYLIGKAIVGVLDYHTGLGQEATGQLIGIEETDELASAIWGSKFVSRGADNSIAPYIPHGTLLAGLKAQLPSTTVIAAVYEFGTINETEVFQALRADHWLHVHGDLFSQQAQQIKRDMLQAFYGDRPEWQKPVCDLAFSAQEELLTGLRTI